MGEYMKYKINDLVTRKSYDNDIVFKIVDIDEETYYLKGMTVRLYADSFEEDLQIFEDTLDESEFLERIKPNIDVERSDYFYLPGKVLHIDGDSEYLNRCLNYYTSAKIAAIGLIIKEDEIASKVKSLLEEYMPQILVITGHDAYYEKKGGINNVKAYKNSLNFINAVTEARKYEKSHEKLIIIAGACQSDYEELIKAGANFASSPKRINIHALDPAIVATRMSLADATKDINLKSILETTKYGHEGVGGLTTKGTMYTGYPR